MTPFRVACVQFAPAFAEPHANASRCAEWLQDAADADASLVVFPEAAITGYCARSYEEARDIAVESDSDPMLRFADAVRAAGLHAVVGFAERAGAELFNSALVCGPDGPIGLYRKTHLPYLGFDKHAKRGSALDVFELPFCKLGVLICYDIRVPEAARVLALKGADIVALPTNWPDKAQRSPQIVCPTRAMENRIYVAASSRVGEENGFSFIGMSRVVAPTGDVLASADSQEETVIIADVDVLLARQKRVVIVPDEYELDTFGERQPELYDLISRRDTSAE
ncbi:MAG: carbon-nitrogen hydrolase family protein [Armatimonadetes bacterium]|nr:carbon-nitrogen hydrolase family protein [Armatimonadota bacterium]NOG91953.1 carbon-nitrogen hydrolase family protein [Armatimonadota bacterium]